MKERISEVFRIKIHGLWCNGQHRGLLTNNNNGKQNL